MSKKPSLAAALQTYDRTPATSAAVVAERPASRPRVQVPRTRPAQKAEEPAYSTQAPSRAGKKALIGYFEPSVSKQLKQIGLDRDTTVQDLLAEALNDLFQKYKKPTIA